MPAYRIRRSRSGGSHPRVAGIASGARQTVDAEKIERAGCEPTLPAAQRLGHGAPQRAGEEESGQGEHGEGDTPGEHAGEGAAEDEADGGAGDLAAEDVAVHAPALARGEVVAGERSDGGAGGCGDGTQPDAGEQQR